MWKRSSVEPFVVHELPDSAHPCVAASAGGGVFLEAMSAFGEGVQIALDTHAPELFPTFDRIHCRPFVGVSMDEEHRTAVQIECKFR